MIPANELGKVSLVHFTQGILVTLGLAMLVAWVSWRGCRGRAPRRSGQGLACMGSGVTVEGKTTPATLSAPSVIFLSFLLLILSAPGLLFPTLRPALTLASVLAVLLIWLLSVCFRPLQPGKQDVAFLLVLIVVAIAGWRGLDSQLTLSKLAGVLLGVAAYSATGMAKDEKQARCLTGLLMAAGAAMAITGLCLVTEPQKYAFLSVMYDKLPWMGTLLPELWGGRPNANQLAGTLLMVWPMMLALALARGKRYPVLRGVTWLSTLVVGSALVLCQSRSGWFGAVVGALVVLAVRWRIARRLIVGILVVVVVILMTFVPCSVVVEISAELFDGSTVGTPFGEMSLHGRPAIWSEATRAIQQSPWFGNGLGTFRVYDAADVTNPYDVGIPHAHSMVLQLAYDVGLIGLVCMLALVFVAVLQGFWLIRHAQDWMSAVGLGTVASLIAFGVYGIADTVTLGSKTGVFFWLLIAVVDVVYRIACPGFGTGE